MSSVYDNFVGIRDLEVDGSTLIVDETNDRIGIGVTDPDSKLEVLATTTQLKLSYDANSFATLTVADASHTTIATGESGDLILDAADDVILDSYAGKWRFMRNGTLTNMVSATAADGSKMVFDNQVSDAGYDFKCSDGGSGITALAIDAANAGLVKLNSSLSLKEASSAQADTAAYGQLWVKTATPNQLYFTTDAGDDIQITSGTAMAFVGDITGVTAGVGLSGGGTSGALTVTLDLSELSDVTPANGDKLATLDSDGANEQLTTVANLATLFAGTGLTASSSVIGVDASQTQITAVGTIATGTWQGTAVANSYVAALPTSKVTSGTFADARIAESNVTQHQAAITATGTIASGTWQGTAVASAYLDADTAHLSGAQTFTGTKTLNSFKGTGSVTVTNILDEDAMGSDSDTALATQQSIKAYVTANAGTAANSADLILHMQVFS